MHEFAVLFAERCERAISRSQLIEAGVAFLSERGRTDVSFALVSEHGLADGAQDAEGSADALIFVQGAGPIPGPS